MLHTLSGFYHYRQVLMPLDRRFTPNLGTSILTFQRLSFKDVF